MDHKDLEYSMKAKKLNHRQAHWSLLLACFDFVMHHQPGRSMGKSDASSCQVDHGSSVNDNKDTILLTLDLFAVQALEGLEFIGEEKEILRDQKGDRKWREGGGGQGSKGALEDFCLFCPVVGMVAISKSFTFLWQNLCSRLGRSPAMDCLSLS